jgi:nicotinamidase-related amidase
MKALLVIDVQEDYVGEKRNAKRFPYHSEILLPCINQRIKELSEENCLVVYILNRFFYQSKRFTPQPAKGLDVVSENIFIKNGVNCFSNPELIRFLHENNITELELVGIDGNYCVAASARAGRKNGFSVIFNQCCIEAAKLDNFKKTISSLQNAGIAIQK